MHSWIFRNRHRLRVVYGSQAPGTGELGEPLEDQGPEELSPEELEWLAAPLPCQDAGPARPATLGTVERTGDDVLLLPSSRARA